MTYRILPLRLAPFKPLFALDDDALRAIGARRMTATAPDSAPCRVSLIDAAPGETLILANHMHLAAPSSPYRGGGPVFVRETAVEDRPAKGCIPEMLARRLLSARVYDADAMMIDADVAPGDTLDERLRSWLTDPRAHEIHLHTARRGCYLARAVRAD